MGTQYVLLVRHAARERNWIHPEEQHQMQGWNDDKFSLALGSQAESGLPVTCLLAGVLCDEFRSRNIKVTRILFSTHAVARQTATVFRNILKRRGRYDEVPESFEFKAELTPNTEDDKKMIAIVKTS